MKKIVFPLLLLLAVAGFAVYRSSLAPSASAANAAFENDKLSLNMTKAQTEVRAMEAVAFEIRISDLQNGPVGGEAADLQVRLSMPGMFCGILPAEVKETRPGVYVASGMPVMRGEWQAEAVYRSDGETIRLRLPFKTA